MCRVDLGESSMEKKRVKFGGPHLVCLVHPGGGKRGWEAYK